jgi:hypothetical protein
LTLVKKEDEEMDEVNGNTFMDLLPSEAEVKEIVDTYAKAMINSTEEKTLGKTFTFKISEARSNYYIISSVLDKKEKVAILPRPLASAFNLSLPLDNPEFTFSGYIFDFHQGQLPVCSFNSLINEFKHQNAVSKRDLKSENT